MTLLYLYSVYYDIVNHYVAAVAKLTWHFVTFWRRDNENRMRIVCENN